MAWFLLLEIFDPPVVDLITQLRKALYGRAFKPNVHITVRGPVIDAPESSDFRESVAGETIFLSGVGVFHNVEGSYVYLKAMGPIIDTLLAKKDYPKAEFGINAHVTLYETKHREAADRVFRLLKHERVEFFCRELRLRWQQIGQKDLFSDEAYQQLSVGRPDYRFDIGTPRFDPTLLSRAALLAAALK